MGNWGSDLFRSNSNPAINRIIKDSPGIANFYKTIDDNFSSGLKQAMFAAASRGNIARGTWVGCAFNKAGNEVSQSVASTESAMEAFGLTEIQVRDFIIKWDSLEGTDKACTKLLQGLLEKSGLFRSSGDSRANVFARKVFVSQDKLWKEFDGLMKTHQVPHEDVAHSILVGTATS